jgi:hypothetical protein
MFYTGTALVILAVYNVIVGEDYLFVNHILEIFGASILIGVGITIRYKFEIRNVILEHIINVGYAIFVILAFRIIFKWHTLPVWLLIITVVVVHIFLSITTIKKMHKDTDEINELLKKRREQNKDIRVV